PRRAVAGISGGDEPRYLASPVAACIRSSRTLTTLGVILILGSERIDPRWSCVLHRGDDVRQSLAIDVAMARFHRPAGGRDRDSVSISTIRRGCREREGSRSEVHTCRSRLVYRRDGDAGLNSDLQLWYLHANHRLTGSFLACIFWCVSSRVNSGFHYDDDRGCVE